MSSGRGFGRGRGGQRQGIGGSATCRCPNCGYSVPHSRGTPCSGISCPKCGSRLMGST